MNDVVKAHCGEGEDLAMYVHNLGHVAATYPQETHMVCKGVDSTVQLPDVD